MIRPAWKSMQENLLRWFYHAYENRLGMHLIELFSGRLVIGAATGIKAIRGRGRSARRRALVSRPSRRRW